MVVNLVHLISYYMIGTVIYCNFIINITLKPMAKMIRNYKSVGFLIRPSVFPVENLPKFVTSTGY